MFELYLVKRINMFKKLFGKKVISPQLDYLSTYVNKDKFFVRIAPWDWLNKKEIYVAFKIDDKPAMITMDFWPQEIFLDANGQITVAELISIACEQFIKSNIEIPKNVDEYLINELEKLVNKLQIVEFRDNKEALTEKVDIPMSKQLKK